MKRENYLAPDIELYVASVECGYQVTIGGGEDNFNQEEIGETKPDGAW